MIKDIFEDHRRHVSDREENNRSVEILRNGNFHQMQWKDIYIGDIVKVKDNEFLPCDMIVLKSSDPKGTVFVETKNLDGETNLKFKQCPK